MFLSFFVGFGYQLIYLETFVARREKSNAGKQSMACILSQTCERTDGWFSGGDLRCIRQDWIQRTKQILIKDGGL